MKNQALIPNKDGAPGDLSEDLTMLAAEMAKDLVPPEQVSQAWGLDEHEHRALLRSPEFSALLKVERAKWNAPTNTNERIKVKSLMAVENTSISMVSIVNDPESGPVARVKAFAELVRIGGADNAGIAKANASGRGAGDSGDRFSVSIHIGQKEQVAIEVDKPIEEPIEEPIREGSYLLGL